MRKDLCNKVTPVVAIAPAAAHTDNTAWVSGIINTAGFNSCTFLIETGSLADADATFAVTLEHGNDPALGDTTQVADGPDLIGTLELASFTFAADNACFKLGYAGVKQYLRLTVTPTNNGGTAFCSAIALLGDAMSEPTDNPPGSGTPGV